MRIILVLTLLFLAFSAYAKPQASPDEVNKSLSDRGILDRIGDVVEFTTITGGVVKAKVVDPVFFDKDGEKNNV